MFNAPQIIAPYVIQHEQIEQQIRAAWYEWRKAWEESQPKFEPQNIRFEHDPCWQYRIISIQNAHDGNTAFWKGAKIIMTVTFGIL